MSMLKPIQNPFNIDIYASANMAENNPKCLNKDSVGYVHPMNMENPFQNPFNIDIYAPDNMAETIQYISIRLGRICTVGSIYMLHLFFFLHIDGRNYV